MILKWNTTRDPHALDVADEPGIIADVDTFDYLSMCTRLSGTKAVVELGLTEESTSPTTTEGWKEAFTQLVDMTFSTPEALTTWATAQLTELHRQRQPVVAFVPSRAHSGPQGHCTDRGAAERHH